MQVEDVKLADYRTLMRSRTPIEVVPKLASSLEDLMSVAPTAKERAAVSMYFGMFNHVGGNPEKACTQFLAAFDASGNTLALINAVICSRDQKAGKYSADLEQKAVAHAEKIKDSDLKAQLYDALCHKAGNHDRLSTAARFGRESLRIKDAIQGRGVALANRKRPEFDFSRPERNIISFSLFGAKERYTRIALENAKAVRHVYPGWTCRFAVDNSVPEPVLAALSSEGAQIHISPELHDPANNSGLFWRFLVASNPGVDFFLVRDADSVINVREKVAVDEWIASDRDFHVLRDFYTHSELILAGLWGGVGGRIANIRAEIGRWHANWPGTQIGVHNHDQLFLRSRIWPAIKTSLMQHDSVFRGDGTRDFPTVGQIHPVRHVGQDTSIFMKIDALEE